MGDDGGAQRRGAGHLPSHSKTMMGKGIFLASQIFNEDHSGIWRRDENNNEIEDVPAPNKCNLQCAENHRTGEVVANKRVEYYINDSVYMSFNMCFFNEDVIRPEPLQLKEVSKPTV